MLRFVAMSDTHCRHRDHVSLPPGDVLLHCGDFTMKGGLAEVSDFADWLTSLTQYKHKVIIAGNHELTLDVPFYKCVTMKMCILDHHDIAVFTKSRCTAWSNAITCLQRVSSPQ